VTGPVDFGVVCKIVMLYFLHCVEVEELRFISSRMQTKQQR